MSDSVVGRDVLVTGEVVGSESPGAGDTVPVAVG
jgi:hypothetical protein